MRNKHSTTEKELTLGARDAAIVFRASAELGDAPRVEFYTPHTGTYLEDKVPPTEPVSFTAVLGSVLMNPTLFALAATFTNRELDALERAMRELN